MNRPAARTLVLPPASPAPATAALTVVANSAGVPTQKALRRFGSFHTSNAYRSGYRCTRYLAIAWKKSGRGCENITSCVSGHEPPDAAAQHGVPTRLRMTLMRYVLAQAIA